MQRIRSFWQSGIIGKIVLSVAGIFLFLILCCVIILIIPSSKQNTAAKPTTVEVDTVVTAVAIAPSSVPTSTPAATEMPVPTMTPEPPTIAPTPVPTALPTPDTPEAHYIAIARAGVTIPSVRTAGMSKGEWKADVIDNGNGPEITLTMPVGIGLSNEQMLRQAKRQIAQAVKALFDSDPKIARVSVTGTLPDGAGGTELGVALIYVERATYTAWDGLPDSLGNWRIPARYQ